MTNPTDTFSEFDRKMRDAGVSEAAIRAFRHNYEGLAAGGTGLFPEDSVQPIADLPKLKDLKPASEPPDRLLSQTLVIKLNGGLGTSMGLERAKSLLEVKNGLTFLDFIARQVLHLRRETGSHLRFMLMNSFSTSADTLEFLARYPELGSASDLELLQSQAPKVDVKTLRPASWPQNPQLEWCPPGHGDIYPSFLGSGLLDRLLAEGVHYLFVSNADNLGASLDLTLLDFFAGSDHDFLMEVAERTESDRKGGHLALHQGRLLLRESAQCPEADMDAFQDVQRHRFFNTNNLWIKLRGLKSLIEAHGGFIPLPLIRNRKNLDPRDRNSPPVYQLETAMGAAIGSFENAGAMVVPRYRFAPVKTTSDLFALRSDAYSVTDDWRVVLANGHASQPPSIALDANHYRLVDQLDAKLAGGIPSLRFCRELTVNGPVLFGAGQTFRDRVQITNSASEPVNLPPGVYSGEVKLP
jgi:UDP-N-acetylglucosamine pyrophosphorylase